VGLFYFNRGRSEGQKKANQKKEGKLNKVWKSEVRARRSFSMNARHEKSAETFNHYKKRRRA